MSDDRSHFVNNVAAHRKAEDAAHRALNGGDENVARREFNKMTSIHKELASKHGHGVSDHLEYSLHRKKNPGDLGKYYDDNHKSFKKGKPTRWLT